MATGSTASSGTEGLDPQDSDETPAQVAATPSAAPGRPPSPAEAALPADAAPVAEPAPSAGAATQAEVEHDASRRAFFFEFGKQAVTAAGQVAGMTDLVSRTSGGGIASLLGLDEPAAPAERPAFARSEGGPVSAAPPAADDAFRSPYRLAGDELVLLDQRGLPERLDEVAAKRGSDVAYYLRLGVASGGPVLAQVAAYGLALTAAERADQPGDQRDVELRRTERTLVEARPSSRLLAWSMARMRASVAGFGESSPGSEVALALRAEADAIAADFSSWHATISHALGDLLAPPDERPIAVVVHGDLGAQSGGLVGAGFPAVVRLRDARRKVRVFVTEGRPFMDGDRLASWELRQAGIEHKILPDSAVAWLLERESIDAVVIGAEWVAANGDTGALIGSRAIAQLAAAAQTRVIAIAVSATIDEATPDGSAIPVELRPARDLVAYLADTPIRASDALVPAGDVMPAATVSVLLTEQGAVSPGVVA
jgi:methylthioribose-1-phosphate isomerase